MHPRQIVFDWTVWHSAQNDVAAEQVGWTHCLFAFSINPVLQIQACWLLESIPNTLFEAPSQLLHNVGSKEQLVHEGWHRAQVKDPSRLTTW